MTSNYDNNLLLEEKKKQWNTSATLIKSLELLVYLNDKKLMILK